MCHKTHRAFWHHSPPSREIVFNIFWFVSFSHLWGLIFIPLVGTFKLRTMQEKNPRNEKILDYYRDVNICVKRILESLHSFRSFFISINIYILFCHSLIYLFTNGQILFLFYDLNVLWMPFSSVSEHPSSLCRRVGGNGGGCRC